MQLVSIADVFQARGIGVESLVCFLTTLCPDMTYAVCDGRLLIDNISARSVADASAELARFMGVGETKGATR